MSDEELIEYYNQFIEFEEADRLIGGFNFDAEVSAANESTYISFEREFEKRNIGEVLFV